MKPNRPHLKIFSTAADQAEKESYAKIIQAILAKEGLLGQADTGRTPGVISVGKDIIDKLRAGGVDAAALKKHGFGLVTDDKGMISVVDVLAAAESKTGPGRS